MHWTALVVVLTLAGSLAAPSAPDQYNVRDYDAKGDGQGDDTAAFQAALDAAIQATGGTLLVRGCEFRRNAPQVDLGEGVRRAVISDNLFSGTARVTNRSKGNVV